MTPTSLARRLLGAFAAMSLTLGALAPAAQAATIPVSTPAGLTAALATAQDGDTILLATGVYGSFGTPGVKHQVPVTIMAAPNADGTRADPVFTTRTGVWGGGGGYILDGLDFQLSAADPYHVSLDIEGVSDVTVQNCRFTGPSQTLIVGVGILIRDSVRVTVQNSEFAWLDTPIEGVADSQGALDTIAVTADSFHDIGSNGVLFLGVTNAVFKAITGTNWHNANGTHPDFLQYANNNATPAVTSANVQIIGNHFERGAGDPSQGIFIEDGDGWTVTGNSMLGTMVNGIAFARSTHVTANDNFVQPYADSVANGGSIILVRQAASFITAIDNIATVVIGTTADAPTDQPTNITPPTGNVAPPPATSPTDYAAYNAWLTSQAAVAGPSTPPVIPAQAGTDPLQPRLDAANATIATQAATIAGAQQQISALTSQAQAATLAQQAAATALAAAQGQVTALQGQASALTGQLIAAQASAAQVKSLQAQLTALQAKTKAAAADAAKVVTDAAKVPADLK